MSELIEIGVTDYAQRRGGVNRNNVAFQAKEGNLHNLPGVKEIKRIGDRYSFIVDPSEITIGRRVKR